MAKGTQKKPKESKCRGARAPIEGRDWVQIGSNKWLREVAEKQGKFIPLEYREKSGAEFSKERAARAAEVEAASRARALTPVAEEEIEVPDAEPQDASPFSTHAEVEPVPEPEPAAAAEPEAEAAPEAEAEPEAEAVLEPEAAEEPAAEEPESSDE